MYIEDYDWTVDIYYDVSCENTYCIYRALRAANASRHIVKQGVNNIKDCKYNTWFTYSNNKYHKSIIVISIADSNAQFINTLMHELNHLVNDICSYYNINTDLEKHSYLFGDICEHLYDVICDKICNGGRGYEQ